MGQARRQVTPADEELLLHHLRTIKRKDDEGAWHALAEKVDKSPLDPYVLLTSNPRRLLSSRLANGVPSTGLTRITLMTSFVGIPGSGSGPSPNLEASIRAS
jgi:hypothetical protein